MRLASFAFAVSLSASFSGQLLAGDGCLRAPLGQRLDWNDAR